MQRMNAGEVMPPRLGVSMEARVDGRSEIDVALELFLESGVFNKNGQLCAHKQESAQAR